jgi:hypothetical protein
MKIVFVIALICSITGIFYGNYKLVNAAFFSIYLFPFLDWLDIPIKIPQSTAGALIFSILQYLAILLINFLIDRFF